MSDSDVVISVENLSKSYLIGHQAERAAYETFRETMLQYGKNVGRKALGILRGQALVPGPEKEEFWALKDVSFEVRTGEAVGIIGRNGAGKSTLLKVLSAITEPTRGRVRTKGRVASLLEVGTGFHPELTGRENIYLNGAILGMSRKEVRTKFDQIVDFAEVERFLDTPVKRYSSGMYVRLAFAVAAHLEPEILVVDEVLAVGDTVFQKKCLGKMSSVAESGRTVLFVSHNMQAITGLTQRAFCLEKGRLLLYGNSVEVVEEYLMLQGSGEPVFEQSANLEEPTITRVEVETSGPSNVHKQGEPLSVRIEVETPFAVPNAAISFQILATSNQAVLHILNNDSEVPMLRTSGKHELVCHLPKLRLYPGHYYLDLHFGSSDPRRVFDAPKRICYFEVSKFGEQRDFYWYPGTALYVEEAFWTTK